MLHINPTRKRRKSAGPSLARRVGVISTPSLSGILRIRGPCRKSAKPRSAGGYACIDPRLAAGYYVPPKRPPARGTDRRVRSTRRSRRLADPRQCVMDASLKEAARSLPATPWGLLPPRMRVLYITTPRRAGAWLAEAFASDSACQVRMEEAVGAAAGLECLHDQAFDAVLISHEPAELDALELLDGLRAGGADEPLVVFGQASEQEMAALCYEVGADAYVCVNTVTTRTVLWIVARAMERRNLIRENRRLSQAERHRLQHEQHEAERLLGEQRGLIRDLEALGGGRSDDAPTTTNSQNCVATGTPPQLDDAVRTHYRQLMRAHVIMGSGNLSVEMSALAELLAASGVTAPQAMKMHVEVLEELVRGLGSRSARHVMTRADLLVLEILIHLGESYRLRCLAVDVESRQRSP
jgi:CheY-like chemotaxis protein